MTIEAGLYKARGIAGSEQYGTTSGGHDQIALDLAFTDLGTTVSTFLVFSEKSAKYSIDRLRALGWQGNDLANLVGIDANEVDVAVKYEEYNGEQKMKVEIVTGGSRVTLANPLNDQGKRAFAAKFKGLVAASAPGVAKANGGASGGDDFPFGQNAPGSKASGVKL